MAHLTPEACRAARAILEWSARRLAENARIEESAVHDVEKGRPVREEVKSGIMSAFAAHDVEILDEGGAGARLMSTRGAQFKRPEELDAANDD